MSSIWWRMKRAVDRKMTPNRIRKLTPLSAAYTSARRKLEVLSSRVLSIQRVTDPAKGMNERHGVPPIDLAAQSADVGLDDRGVGIEMHFPHFVQQHRAGDDLPGVSHQILEQQEFAWQQLYAHTGPADRAREQVNLQVGDGQGGLERKRRSPPPERGDSRQQLGEGKGLDEIVIGT